MPTKTAKSKKTTKKGLFARIKKIPFIKPASALFVLILAGVIGVPLISSATTTESLWSSSVTPKVVTWDDTHSTELGTKFKSSVAGYVTGVRFYKGPKNTGTHTGSLWDSAGNRLAGVTFTSETASGWQTAQFANPVSIAANITYIVSYHAPNGHYSLSPDYFKNTNLSNGHLSAPKYTKNDPNGVQITSTAQYAFPKNDGDGDSYFVDVIFSAQLINPQPAPAAPTSVSATIGDNNSVSLSWQASNSQNPIASYTIYRDGAKIGSVGTITNYVDTTVVAGSTYTYQVQAVDNSGVTSALSAGTKVTIPTSTPTPPTGGTGTGTGGTTTGATTTCPLPAYPTPSCSGKPSSVAISNDVKGSYEAKTDGQVIDGWHIAGDLVIEAKNVTIQNSEIDGTVINEVGPSHYGPFTIQDTTVGPATGCIGLPGIGESMYTAKRVYIRNHDDGFRISGNDVSVSDSYVHMCYLPPSQAPPDGSHSDGVQNYCKGDKDVDIPCHNITLDHNTFDNHDVIGNAGIYLGGLPDGNDIQNVTVTNNLMWGGGYSFYSIWHAGPEWTVSGNRIASNNGYQYGPVDAEGTCSQQNWSNNSIVTVDSTYAITSTVKPLDCIN